MTTLRELSKLKNDDSWNFPVDLLDIDIGDYSFTEVKETHLFIYLFTNKNEPNIALKYNDDRNCVLLYVLNDDDTVNVTSWFSGNYKYKDVVSKERLKNYLNDMGKNRTNRYKNYFKKFAEASRQTNEFQQKCR